MSFGQGAILLQELYLREIKPISVGGYLHKDFFCSILCLFFLFKKIFYLFIYFRERNINVQLPLMCPLLGTWPATQACALTGNQTSDRLVCRPVLNPLSHTSQGVSFVITKKKNPQNNLNVY